MRLVRAVAATACVVVAALPTLGHASSFARNPLNALEVLRNPSVHTYNHRVTALSQFGLSFDLRDGAHLVRLSLEPNHDILADDATVEYIGPDGQVTRREPIDRLDHKVYKGRAWVKNNENAVWQDRGWARVNVRRDGVHPLFEGVFSIDHDHHHIQMSSSYMQTKHAMDPALEDADDEFMVVWRDSDISATNYGSHDELRKRRFDDGFACQADGLPFNSNLEHPIFASMLKRDQRSWGSVSMSNLFSKRQIDTQPGGNSAGVNLVSTIGQTSGCPLARKVALVGVATDCTYTGSFNSSESVRQNVISVINSASDLYETTFNITLGLRNLTVSDATCPGTPQEATKWNQACADSITIQDRLNMFSEWRGSRPDTNSHWTLLTTCNTGQAVGLAWLGQACVQGLESGGGNSTGSGSTNGASGESVAGANVVARTNTEWQVVAHETGHTFGAVHDCTSQTCADSSLVNSQQCCPLSSSQCDAGEQYIMNPSTAQGITKFSPCSIGNICSAIGRNSVKTNCFTNNKGVTTISGQQCGNGIVEEGEDCDCGGADGCGNNPCCNPTTCKFKSGAVCDDSNEDCCRGCQFASNGTVCRESTGECDPQEVCSGDSAYCPADNNAEDGTKCGNGLKCASGQCTSRDQQCKTALGAYTQGTNDTYACNHQTCQISCASPEFGANVCYNLQQNFLDGTDCGGGGHCKNGRCSGSSTVKEIGSWIQDHKGIVIGICAAIGALLLLSLFGCISRRIRRRSANRRAKTAAPWVPLPPPGMAMGPGPGYPPGGGPGGPAPFPPPHIPRSPMPWAPAGRQTPDSQRPFAMNRGSVSGATSSGTGSWHSGAPPPIPPPVLAHPPPAYSSVRYA